MAVLEAVRWSARRGRRGATAGRLVQAVETKRASSKGPAVVVPALGGGLGLSLATGMDLVAICRSGGGRSVAERLVARLAPTGAFFRRHLTPTTGAPFR